MILPILFLFATPARFPLGPDRCEPVTGSPVRDQPYRSYTTQDSLGRTIQFYLSEAPRGWRLPIVLYVQGSGAQSHFLSRDGRILPATGHATLIDVSAGRARVLIVEKPGTVPFAPAADTLPRAFRLEHTLERWAEAVAAAFCAARRLPGIDTTKALIIGHSEGGLVAARVASRLPALTHVALLAAGGPSQLYDLQLQARRGIFFANVSADSAERERYVLAQWDSIRAHPQDPDRLFLGHPYRRWASFLASSPMRELESSSAHLFLAQGEADPAVTRESFDLLTSHLLSESRAPVVRLIPLADHSFAIQMPDGQHVDGWSMILSDIVHWFLGP